MMKHLFLLFFLVVITAASAIADEPNESRLEAEPFVHPGLLHSRAELDFVREKVQAGQEPWKSAWEGCDRLGRISLIDVGVVGRVTMIRKGPAYRR